MKDKLIWFIIQVEEFGVARAWLAEEVLFLLIESSEAQLSKLTAFYMANTISLGPGLELLKVLSKFLQLNIYYLKVETL